MLNPAQAMGAGLDKSVPQHAQYFALPHARVVKRFLLEVRRKVPMACDGSPRLRNPCGHVPASQALDNKSWRRRWQSSHPLVSFCAYPGWPEVPYPVRVSARRDENKK